MEITGCMHQPKRMDLIFAFEVLNIGSDEQIWVLEGPTNAASLLTSHSFLVLLVVYVCVPFLVVGCSFENHVIEMYYLQISLFL